MKTVLITGANKSIGFETAKQLTTQGHKVYVGSRDLQKGEAAVAQLKEQGAQNVEAIQIDITDRPSIQAASERVGRQEGQLDILINNAGISGDQQQAPSSVSTDEIRKVFDTNFFGTIDVTQAFMDLLKKSDQPRIVNVTSGLGSLTQVNSTWWADIIMAAYGPSKTALNAYTNALARELKDTAFKINVVDPGYTATDFNNHSGPGTVEDAGAIIVKYALIGEDGPTGKFFSNDAPGEGDECPW